MTEPLVQPVKKPGISDRLVFFGSIATLLLAAVLIIFALFNAVNNQKQQAAINKQTETTNELVKEVRDLSEQNKDLAQTAANYAYCNSILLASYTQDQAPITVEDLNKCVFTSFPDGQGAPTTASNLQGTINTSNTSRSSQTSSTSGSSVQPAGNGNTQPSGGTVVIPPSTTIQPSNSSPLLQVQPTSILPSIDLGIPCIDTGLLGIRTCR